MSTPRLCRALGAAQAGGAHRRANELCPAASRAPGCAGGGARGGRACAGGLARGCPAAPRTVAQAAAVFQRGHAQKGAVLGLRALSTLSEVGSKRAIRESAGRQCITDSVLRHVRERCARPRLAKVAPRASRRRATVSHAPALAAPWPCKPSRPARTFDDVAASFVASIHRFLDRFGARLISRGRSMAMMAA